MEPGHVMRAVACLIAVIGAAIIIAGFPIIGIIITFFGFLSINVDLDDEIV